MATWQEARDAHRNLWSYLGKQPGEQDEQDLLNDEVLGYVAIAFDGANTAKNASYQTFHSNKERELDDAARDLADLYVQMANEAGLYEE